VFPQLQVTWISVYLGWIPDFIVSSFSALGRDRAIRTTVPARLPARCGRCGWYQGCQRGQTKIMPSLALQCNKRENGRRVGRQGTSSFCSM